MHFQKIITICLQIGYKYISYVQRVDEKVKPSKVRSFKLLSGSELCWMVPTLSGAATHQPTVAASQVGNFNIKASFVSIFFHFGIFEAVFCVK